MSVVVAGWRTSAVAHAHHAAAHAACALRASVRSRRGAQQSTGGRFRLRAAAREVAVLRLFAGAREAAGTGRDDIPGVTVAEVIDAARARYGERFAEIVEHCQVWLNGEPSQGTDPVGDDDEVAVLPPVSGGQA